MNTYIYECYGDEEEIETILDDNDLKYVAIECTEDYLEKYGIEESQMSITLNDLKGDKHLFDIWVEYEPIFGASEVLKEESNQ